MYFFFSMKKYFVRGELALLARKFTLSVTATSLAERRDLQKRSGTDAETEAKSIRSRAQCL